MSFAARPRTLVLASGSPRRTALLDEWGFRHFVCPSRFEEVLDAAVEVGRLTEDLARSKAKDVIHRLAASDDPLLRTAVCLAADTLVSCDGRHLGKPQDAEDARRMLRAISGRDVLVVTGVAVCAADELHDLETMHSRSTVIMRRFSDAEADEYVLTGEPMDKAGAFAVQGLGGRLIAEVRGSLSNVIGLPRELVFPMLGRRGVMPSVG